MTRKRKTFNFCGNGLRLDYVSILVDNNCFITNNNSHRIVCSIIIVSITKQVICNAILEYVRLAQKFDTFTRLFSLMNKPQSK